MTNEQIAQMQGISTGELAARLRDWTPEQWQAEDDWIAAAGDCGEAVVIGDNLTFSTAVVKLASLGRGIDLDAAHAIVSRAAEHGYCLVAGDELLVQATTSDRDRFAITSD